MENKDILNSIEGVESWAAGAKTLLAGFKGIVSQTEGLSEEQKKDFSKAMDNVPFDQAMKDIDNVVKEVEEIKKSM